MTESDVDAVLAIERASYPTPWGRTAFLGEVHGGEASYALVAEARSEGGREIVGFLCSWIVRDIMQVNNIAVAASWRRRGLGETMLRATLEEGENRGVESCFLDVRPSNEAALALYGKLGFFEIGRRRGYYSDTREDALVMKLDLADLAAN
jgi:ribosomal-protein-alanine N-acetyltransferase